MVHACARDLDAILPNEILLFGDEQFGHRDEWNARPGSLHGIPAPFDPEIPTHWVEAVTLSGVKPRFIPAGCAWLWYPFHEQPFYNFADTNGCAAGSSEEEATLRALLELIERDSLAIWWYNRARRPAVPLHDTPISELRSAVDLFRGNHRTLTLLDLTHDLRIPVYAAVSADDHGRNIYHGSAADPCPTKAAKRAVAEVIQFWYWESRFGVNEDRRLWFDRGTIDAHPHLLPAGAIELPQAHSPSISEALRRCLEALKAAQIGAYAVHLSRPELDIPVVRVVAPGLRHYGPRFAPGRLFDVPYKLGWVAAPLSPAELNPDVCVL